MSKNIQLVKLVNNELMIGDVVDNDDSITIKKSFQLGMVRDPEGRDQMVFMDLNEHLGNCEELTIQKTNVLYSWPASSEVETSYIQRSTGIELVTRGTTAPELDLSNLAN